MEKKNLKKIRCPVCGHPVNVFYKEGAVCKGVFFKCKNKACGTIFEPQLDKD